jgi:uncharacterized protein DUF4440
MRFFTIFFVCLSVVGLAQKSETRMLNIEVAEFDRALINKDSVTLKRLLNNDLSYGHSNGWIQMKTDVIGDMYNGKLTYKAIESRQGDVRVEGNTAWVRIYSELEVVMEGKPLQLKLNVLQVWVWKNKHWELFARQSVKV